MKNTVVSSLSSLVVVVAMFSISGVAVAKPTQCYSMKDGTELNARIKNDTSKNLSCTVECSYAAQDGSDMLYECDATVPASSEVVACTWPLTKALAVKKIVKSLSTCEPLPPKE